MNQPLKILLVLLVCKFPILFFAVFVFIIGGF